MGNETDGTGTLIERFRKQIDIAVQLQQLDIREKGGISTGLVVKNDGTYEVMAITNDFMESNNSKNRLALLLMKAACEPGTQCLIFCSDSWRENLPDGVKRSSLPANMGEWPEEWRTEALICTVNAWGSKGECAEQRYTRDEAGQPVFGPLDLAHVIQHRFAFDLRREAVLQRVSHQLGGTS